ncbi:MAG: YifB family Mg chelatase-like AAA ATPase [Ancrocorticia sp.]|uniref:YifB family Mg chelatase-like AAA ATPase n=1 Tax=Ancrocorticia sp. TaxID=2593684 RepID=UPI003F90731D
MKLGIAQAISVVGVEGHAVRIEVALLRGLPAFTIVGLPDAAVSESRERIRAAFAAAGIGFPTERVTVNLSPADTPKSGTGFDLGIAVAIIAAMSSWRADDNVVWIGELGLDGSVRPVRGILPAALSLAKTPGAHLVVPYASREEASFAQIDVSALWHLSEVAQDAGIACAPAPDIADAEPTRHVESAVSCDFEDVRGQEEARRALEISAAGGHHLLMTGSAGIGKSMLASCLPGILPCLSLAQAVEVASIASAVGEFDGHLSLVPPLSSPHHTASAAALIGGGTVPRPGAISRAHHGVLYLDELPEFSRSVLQALRQPMEEGHIDIHRARHSVRFPSEFQLIGAANPCRCGMFYEDSLQCTCSPRERRDYFRRIGGPMIDRFDLSIVLHRLSRAELAEHVGGEPSRIVAQRVACAHERMLARLEGTAWANNAQASTAWLRKNTTLPERASDRMNNVLATGQLSMRGVTKVLRVAWTLADLAGRDAPAEADVDEAFALRGRGV